jgi:YggT family protein
MNTAMVLRDFLGGVSLLLWGAILVRVCMSWFAITNASSTLPVVRLLDDITQPILAPLRRFIPPIGMIDITPLIAILLVQAVFGVLIHQIH